MKKVENFHNWFAALPDDIQDEMKLRFIKKTYAKGSYLYKNGDPTAHSFQIISGKVKICNYSDQGQEFIIAYLYPGDWCGDVGTITQHDRFNNAVSTEETVANTLSNEDFYFFYDKYPELAKALNVVLSIRLQSALSRIEDSCLLPLNFKLARTLARLGTSIGEKQDDGGCIINNFSHDDLGRLVGATRQSVSRELKQMEKGGLLTLKYGKLIILNLPDFIDKFDDLIGHEPIVATYD